MPEILYGGGMYGDEPLRDPVSAETRHQIGMAFELGISREVIEAEFGADVVLQVVQSDTYEDLSLDEEEYRAA